MSYTSCIGISTPRPKASLDPRPPNIRRDGTWHEFTVHSNVPVKVVANDSDRTLRLSSTGRGGCPASSQNASVLRTDGQTVKLMGCKVGDARVRLSSQSDDTRLRTYNFRVLAPPPTPTPTPGPAPDTCPTTDIGVLRFLDTRPEYRFDGTWGAPCNGSLPAKLFTFTLPDIASPYVDDRGARRLYYHEHHVVVDLTSTSGLAPRLILRGQAESTDNPESRFSTGHARLGRTLGAGTYTIEASLTDTSSTNPDAELALIVRVEEGLPVEAHQGDHTGVFFINDTSTLTASQRADFLDTIELAVNAWNNAASSTWPLVKLCKDDCSGNLDGLSVPIRTSPSTACGGIACVTFGVLAGKDDEHRDYPTKMTIEYPAIVSSSQPGVPDLEYRWTLVPSLHKQPVDILLGGFPKWFYLPSTILHEFGHVLGLEDLYQTEHGDRYTDYLMGDAGTHTTVPDADIRYLKQVYRHHGGRPHR